MIANSWSAISRVATQHEQRVVLVLLAAGVCVRLAWLFLTNGGLLPRDTETQMVAVALTTTGQFADAFRVGSGPTAHVSPIMPWVISLVYRLGGIGTPASEIALSLIAIALITLSFYFMFSLARELDIPRWSRLGALAVVTLVPLQLPLEVRELKVWEAPLVVALVTGALVFALKADRADSPNWRRFLYLILPGAIVFLASPPAALAIFSVAAVLAVRRTPMRRWLPLAIGAVAATLIVTLPWAIRNEQVFGKWIFTRSNGGLELSLSYNQTVLSMADRRAGYLARLDEIHPRPINSAGYAKLRAAGGEVPYFEAEGARAQTWIGDHPGGATELLLRHIRQYLLPPAWFFDTWGAPARASEVRRWLIGLPTLIALLGLPFLIWRDRRYVYPAVVCVMLAAPYVVVQPILRYRYLTSTIGIFIAFAVLAVALSAARSLHQRR